MGRILSFSAAVAVKHLIYDIESRLFCGVVDLDISLSDGSGADKLSHSLDNGLPSNGAQGVSLPMNYMRKKSAIVHMGFSFSLRLLLLLFCDRQLVSCSASKKGLKQADLIKVEKKLASGYAVCASVASEQQILAVGTKRGDVELYDLTDSASLVHAVSLYGWGKVVCFKLHGRTLICCIQPSPSTIRLSRATALNIIASYFLDDLLGVHQLNFHNLNIQDEN
ncbi:uncharacterized protein [Coffea arabica]|uniref:Uncharacterized protein LOC113722695 n=1 Tax=Coffea arabica TaxID=13443 RepID=A0A6P6VGF7_COFAR|nr:uncharacterized protein LOC113722695 [Coffea arabica]XP_027101754.1 uncharacterized protein LOC113722695 [Coffea arabica]